LDLFSPLFDAFDFSDGGEAPLGFSGVLLPDVGVVAINDQSSIITLQAYQ
jgi:hypothetical protein